MNNVYRALASGHNLFDDKEDGRVVEHLARAMHECVCGSWEAAGFDVKLDFIIAAAAARDTLAVDGWGTFAFPDGGWGLVA